jgi:ATP-dependent Lhr-like helicase
MVNVAKRAGVLELFHPAVAEWFRASFEAPTPPQSEGWPSIARGESTLILAPTGSGKTLTAFLWAINRVMFPPPLPPSLAPNPPRASADKRRKGGPVPPKLRSSEDGRSRRVRVCRRL